MVELMLKRMKADPLAHMARLMKNPKVDPRLRFDAAKELAQYVAPKRKALEITGHDDGPVTLHVVYDK